MRPTKTRYVLVAVATVAAWTAEAQGAFLGGNVGLLIVKEARDELGMDATQTERAMALIDEHNQATRKALEGVEDLPAADRQHAALERWRAVNQKSKAILSTILRPEQMRRYEQIELWESGALALTDPQVQETLNITGAQKTQLQECAAEYAKMEDSFIGQKTPREKRREIEDAEMEKAMSILTEAQRKKWDVLRGKPPKF